MEGQVVIKRLNGPLFFGFTSQFRGMISSLPDMKVFVMRMDRVPFIDQSGVFALEAAIKELTEREIVMAISEPNAQVTKLLSKMKIIPRLIPDERIFKNFSDCRYWLRHEISEH